VLRRGGQELLSRRQELAKVSDLSAKVAQARDGAQRVERLLRRRGVDVPVKPVLLPTGPGAPYMPPVVEHGDVTITAFRDRKVMPDGAADASANDSTWSQHGGPPLSSSPTAKTARSTSALAATASRQVDWPTGDCAVCSADESSVPPGGHSHGRLSA
jgi:hypothetical protein